jgi:hypothetical protein
LTNSNHFLDFDYKTYQPKNKKLRFFISSMAAKAEFVFRSEGGDRIRAQYQLTGGLATKALHVIEASETVTVSGVQARKADRVLISRNGFRDEKSFEWAGPAIVSIAEAPFVFEHAWDQLRRACSHDEKTAVTVEFNDGTKIRKIAILRSANMNSEADVFLLREGAGPGKRSLVLTFQGNRLLMFGIDVPVIGLVKFVLDER